jgi:hypothetical protein
MAPAKRMLMLNLQKEVREIHGMISSYTEEGTTTKPW